MIYFIDKWFFSQNNLSSNRLKNSFPRSLGGAREHNGEKHYFDKPSSDLYWAVTCWAIWRSIHQDAIL